MSSCRAGAPGSRPRPRRPAHVRDAPHRPTRGRLGPVLASALALLAAGLLLPSVARAAGASRTAAPVTAADGARVVAETRVDSRTVDLTVDSPALRGTGRVRLILPAGWSARSRHRWPALYLLHGANEPIDYASWTTFTDVESFLATKNVLGVMPTDGLSGIYSASWSYGRHSGPDYETFHTVELPQLLSRGYRASGVNAVAGLSIGGLGAVNYAARHRGLFRAAASYSGMLDTLMPGGPAVIAGIRLRAGTDPLALWGSPRLQRDIWKAHNPLDLAPRLTGVRVYVSAGDGAPGTLDRSSVPDVIEPLARLSAERFVRRMHRLGLPVTAHLYHGGTHTWPYWQREFHASWPLLAAALGVRA